MKVMGDSEVAELRESNFAGGRQSQFSNARETKKEDEWQIEDQE